MNLQTYIFMELLKKPAENSAKKLILNIIDAEVAFLLAL